MIRAREVRIIDEDKSQVGILSIEEAHNLAEERGLDLVEVAPNANPPVCRVMDYGKFLYELHKKEQEAKKHQKNIQVKEIKFRPKISIHDYTFKIKHVQRLCSGAVKRPNLSWPTRSWIACSAMSWIWDKGMEVLARSPGLFLHF